MVLFLFSAVVVTVIMMTVSRMRYYTTNSFN